MNAPIVFVHGAGHGGIAWHRHRAALGSHRSVLAVDLPGHAAARATRWSTMDDAADEVATAIREWAGPGAAPAYAGFSLGADVGLRLLARHPGLVSSAVLTGLSTVAVACPERVLDAMTWPLARLPLTHRIATRSMRLPPAVRRAYLARTRPMRVGDYARLSREVLGGVSMVGLERSGVPVLALAGARESAHARRSAQLVAERMPRAVAALAPGCGHAWPLQHPELFAATVRRWCDDGQQLHPLLRPLRLPSRRLSGAQHDDLTSPPGASRSVVSLPARLSSSSLTSRRVIVGDLLFRQEPRK